MTKVLIAEDEHPIARLLEMNLTRDRCLRNSLDCSDCR